MASPLVSVVLSTYNSGKYISEAVSSILRQTYRNFEFIIWDDGSTDNTRQIVESFKDDRIHYYYHENTGLGMALRLACGVAKGKYIARMDADDISLPKRIEKQVDFLEENGDFVMVSSAVKYIDANGHELGRSFPCTNSDIIKRSLVFTSMIVHPMVMMRKCAYMEAGGYIPVKAFEDRIFWSKIAKYGNIANLCEVLGNYRLISSSISHSKNMYSGVLYAYRNKIIKDDQIIQEDVELYNEIYTLSKKHDLQDNNSELKYKKQLDEKLYLLLGGGKLAERFVCSLKNVYFFIKLR